MTLITLSIGKICLCKAQAKDEALACIENVFNDMKEDEELNIHVWKEVD